jgi:hypothetical protein
MDIQHRLRALDTQNIGHHIDIYSTDDIYTATLSDTTKHNGLRLNTSLHDNKLIGVKSIDLVLNAIRITACINKREILALVC